MRARRRAAGAIGACLFAAAMGAPSVAWAQNCPNISLSLGTTVNRYYPRAGGDVPQNLYPFRPQNLNPNYINYKDCKDDINLQFTVLVSGLPCTDTIQVWAGTTDCTQTSARESNSGATQCWPVTPTGAFQMQQSSTGNIRAQDIVAYITNAEPPKIYSRHDQTACRSQASPGDVSLSLYFMAVGPDGLTVDGTSAQYDFGADLLGPYPPTNVVAGVGENIIVVNWSPATDSTIQGFNIYCQNKGGMVDGSIPDVAREATLFCPDTGIRSLVDSAIDGMVEASTPIDSGMCTPVNVLDGGGGGGASCVSSVLVDEFQIGQTTQPSLDGAATTPVVSDATTTTDATVASGIVGISDVPDMYLCGQVGGNTTSSYVVQNFSEAGTPIMDGIQYAVGVAAYDGSGNVGILGPLSCVIPSPVIDFWTAYNNAGGLAGGGFCALEGPGMPVSGTLFSMGMGAFGVAALRRRRKRR